MQDKGVLDRGTAADIVIGELGDLRLWLGGTEQPVRGGRTKTVLALLALRGSRGASMDYLVDIVWPDQPPTARQSLANVIRRLRAMMGPESIVTDGSIYRLADTVESHRATLLDAVDRATDSSCDLAEVIETARSVDGLWRGDPWSEFDDQSPLIGDRVVLREARLRLFEAAARAAQRNGDLDAAIRYLQQLVDERPHQERWWCGLADAIASTGDRVAGLRLLQRARAALDQVGISPSPELLEVEGRLLGTYDPTPTTELVQPLSDRRGNPSLRVAEDVPFVGRVQEVARLVEPSGGDHIPTSAVAIVEGPAGAGKSRLILESARRCGGHVVLSGRCAESGWSTLGPMQQILDEYVESTSSDDVRGDLAGFEAVLAEYLPGFTTNAPPLTLERSLMEERERIVRACVAVLTRAGNRRPHLLLIDDLQWASEIVLDMIDELAYRCDPGRLAILATCRFGPVDDPARHRVAQLSVSPNCLQISLGPLSATDVQTIVDGTNAISDADEVLRLSGGNPFFVAELLRSGPGIVDDKTLSRIVRSRVDLVHPRATDFLTTAALCGIDFDPWLVGEVLSLDVSETGELVDELTHHQLVLPGQGDRDRCWFTHGLVAEAMLSSADAQERRRIHLRIADVEQQAGSPVGLWIEHLLGAGPLIDTHTLTVSVVEAVDQLCRRSQPESAASVVRRVLETRLDVPDRVLAMTALAKSLAQNGGMTAEADAILLEAGTLAVDHHLDDALTDVAIAYSRGGPWRRNSDTNGPRLLALALERCPPDRRDLRAHLQARLASYSIFTGPLADRIEAAELAIASARESGDQQALGEALNSAIVAVTSPATLAKTRDLEDEILLLQDAGLAVTEMANRPAVSTYWAGEGQRYQADVAARRARLVSATQIERELLNELETVLANLRGDESEARRLLGEQGFNNDVKRGNHAWNTLATEWLAGDVTRALPVMRRAYDDFRGAPLRYSLLWLAAEADEHELVDELYETITPTRVGRLPEVFLGGFGLAGLAMTAFKLQDRELAAVVEPELKRLTGQMIGVPWSSLPSADFFLALLADTNGDHALAKTRAAAARQAHKRMRAPAFTLLLDRYLPSQ